MKNDDDPPLFFSKIVENYLNFFLFIKFQEGAPDDLQARDRESGVFFFYLIE